jgi:hypothetical protein
MVAMQLVLRIEVPLPKSFIFLPVLVQGCLPAVCVAGLQ